MSIKMSNILGLILTWILILGPFIGCLVWFISSKRNLKKAETKPGFFSKLGHMFSGVFLFLSIIWGLFIWFLDAVMRSM